MTTEPLGIELIERFRRDGFIVLPPDFLDGDLLGTFEELLPRILDRPGPQRIMERDGTTVRSVYGVHRDYDEIRGIACHPRLLGVVEDLVGDQVYVHQSKINIKAALAGDQWEWHQDYIYWLENDGIRKPDLVNVAVFLDEVTEFNGPLTFIPGSHDRGVLSATLAEGVPAGYEDSPEWVSTLTAEEKFKVEGSVLEELARRQGMVSPKGPAGSVMIFHPNLLHASSPNLSPFRRAMMIMVFNGVNNAPVGVAESRPAFLSEPDTRPLRPVSASASAERGTS